MLTLFLSRRAKLTPINPDPDPKQSFKIYKKIGRNLSVLNILAISGTRGSSGLGSQSKEQTDSNT
jgi:hypothetical protein